MFETIQRLYRASCQRRYYHKIPMIYQKHLNVERHIITKEELTWLYPDFTNSAPGFGQTSSKLPIKEGITHI